MMTLSVVERIARGLAKERNLGFNRGYLVAIGSRMSDKELQKEVTDKGWENYIKEAMEINEIVVQHYQRERERSFDISPSCTVTGCPYYDEDSFKNCKKLMRPADCGRAVRSLVGYLE